MKFVALGILLITLVLPAIARQAAFDAGKAIERAEVIAVVKVSWVAPASRANDHNRTARVRVVSPIKGSKPGDILDMQDDSESLQSGGTYLVYAVRADGRLYASRWQQASIWNHSATSDDNDELRGIRQHIAKVAEAKREAIKLHPDLAITGTKLHAEFVRRYHDRLNSDALTYFFSNSKWPLILVGESVEALK